MLLKHGYPTIPRISEGLDRSWCYRMSSRQGAPAATVRGEAPAPESGEAAWGGGGVQRGCCGPGPSSMGSRTHFENSLSSHDLLALPFPPDKTMRSHAALDSSSDWCFLSGIPVCFALELTDFLISIQAHGRRVGLAHRVPCVASVTLLPWMSAETRNSSCSEVKHTRVLGW